MQLALNNTIIFINFIFTNCRRHVIKIEQFNNDITFIHQFSVSILYIYIYIYIYIHSCGRCLGDILCIDK